MLFCFTGRIQIMVYIILNDCYLSKRRRSLSFGHQKAEIVEVVWEGDSLDVIRRFPSPVRQDLGAELRRLQEGNRPLNSRPMPSIGARVYELKEQEERAWYRVIYLVKIGDRIHVLHCFEKKSAKTGKNDLAIAKARLKQVLARLAEEK
jgi:phage-related protein